VKVDEVRILTNRFRGATGLYLAEQLKDRGHTVELLINPHCIGKVRGIKAVYYRYYDEFKRKTVEILKRNHYDAIIHTAAVSDYKIENVFRAKIPSGKKSLTLRMVPTEKIVKKIRALAKDSLLIQFKLEIKNKGLIESGYRSLKENKADFVVANALVDLDKGYRSFIIDKNKDVVILKSKVALGNALDKIISSFYR